MEQWIMGVMAIFAVLGVLEVVFLICHWTYGREKEGETLVILPVQGEVPELEFSLRKIQHNRAWKYHSECQVYLVDLGISEESKRLIRILQRDIQGIYLCSAEDLPKAISQNVCLQSQ